MITDRARNTSPRSTFSCIPTFSLPAIASPQAREWLGAVDAPLEGQANTQDAPDFAPIAAPVMASPGSSGSASAAAASDAAPSTPASSGGGGGASTAPASSSRAGFKWRSGRERTTTGIWLWSRAFVRRLPSGERVAVLLMDTQGLFDTDTAQVLTNSIFGLSTLFSSYVIYNLPNRIQEDYLQNLALFSEYGRRVLEEQRERAADDDRQGAGATAAAAAAAADDEDDDTAAASATPLTSPVVRLHALRARARRRRAAAAAAAAHPSPPFQRIELLVRDADIESDITDLPAFEAEMRAYLGSVLAKSHHSDLKTVREHISASFETVASYLLPHPGLLVRKAEYDGSVRALEPDFVRALCYYVHAVFNENLVAKKVNGGFVNARQLAHYLQAYAALFQDRSVFPEAKLLLEATADAHSRVATDAATASFDGEMAAFVADGAFYRDDELDAHARLCADAALEVFDAMANFGARAPIARAREALAVTLRERSAAAAARNRERNPLKHVELYAVAAAIAVAAYIARIALDYSCAPWLSACARASQLAAFVYSVIILGALIATYAAGRQSWARVAYAVKALAQLAGGGEAAAQVAKLMLGGTEAPRAALTVPAAASRLAAGPRPLGDEARTDAAGASAAGVAAGADADNIVAGDGLRRRRQG